MTNDVALRTLSLCTGLGGLDLGFTEGARRLGLGRPRTVAYVEGEAFCAAHLVGAMEAQQLDDAPIWSDLRTFEPEPWVGVVDCITGGYPCQPFSSAGDRRGKDDPRHLWPVIAELVRVLEPALCFFENVSGHVSLGAHDVFRELQGMGYEVAASLWTAEEVGAPHRRERLFILATHPDRLRLRLKQGRRSGAGGPGASIPVEHGEARALAYSNGERIETSRAVSQSAAQEQPGASHGGPHTDLADADGEGGLQPEGGEPALGGWACDSSGWAVEPDVGRVVDGAPARVDRLRALGNAVVPAQAAAAFVELWNALHGD